MPSNPIPALMDSAPLKIHLTCGHTVTYVALRLCPPVGHLVWCGACGLFVAVQAPGEGA